MLVIRMQRTGRSGHAQFRVVVQDSRRTPTSGKVVASLGHYNPHTKETVLDKEKASFYLEHGAQPSERAARLLKSEGVKLPKWVAKVTKKSGAVKNADKRRSTRPEGVEAPVKPVEPEAAEAPAEPEAPAQEADASSDTPAVEEAPVAAEQAEATETDSSSEAVAEEEAPAQEAAPEVETPAEADGAVKAGEAEPEPAAETSETVEEPAPEAMAEAAENTKSSDKPVK